MYHLHVLILILPFSLYNIIYVSQSPDSQLDCTPCHYHKCTEQENGVPMYVHICVCTWICTIIVIHPHHAPHAHIKKLLIISFKQQIGPYLLS